MAVMIHLLLLFVTFTRIDADIFASVVDLKTTLLSEKTLVQTLKDYVTVEAKRLQDITAIIDIIAENNEKSLENPEENLSNIISAFQTMARLTKQWKEQEQVILSTRVKDKMIADVKSLTHNYPDWHDLRRASESIFRLQDVYALEVEQFANGSLAHNAAQMTAKDCFQVGEVAFVQDDLYHATMWMEHAYKMVAEYGDVSVDQSILFEYLTFALFATRIPENMANVVKLSTKWANSKPNNAKAQNFLKFYKKEMELMMSENLKNCAANRKCENSFREKINQSTSPVYKRIRKEWEEEPDYMRFETLCRGEDVFTSRHLYCSYRRYNPIHVLMPLKEELLHIDPPVAVYHEFLSDKEVEHFKADAAPKLFRSTILGTQDLENKDTHIRTSKTAWLQDDSSPITARVTRRSVAIGNLSMDSCDDMQIVCYGLGGHYSPHFDWASDADFHPWLGNRLATVVHYLSDFVGGYTVFLGLNLRVIPEKGASLFWWNLHRNTEGDQRTKHAGCPVIYGNKWIANKWVHTKGQLFARPCLLDETI